LGGTVSVIIGKASPSERKGDAFPPAVKEKKKDQSCPIKKKKDWLNTHLGVPQNTTYFGNVRLWEKKERGRY